MSLAPVCRAITTTIPCDLMTRFSCWFYSRDHRSSSGSFHGLGIPSNEQLDKGEPRSTHTISRPMPLKVHRGVGRVLFGPDLGANAGSNLIPGTQTTTSVSSLELSLASSLYALNSMDEEATCLHRHGPTYKGQREGRLTARACLASTLFHETRPRAKETERRVERRTSGVVDRGGGPETGEREKRKRGKPNFARTIPQGYYLFYEELRGVGGVAGERFFLLLSNSRLVFYSKDSSSLTIETRRSSCKQI